jgi:TRAP-type C4-dicarboxylate transport system substrate-binding protein
MSSKQGGARLARIVMLCAAVLLIGAVQPLQAKTTWDYYLFTGITHPVSVYLKGFADEVSKRTNGELTIVVRPAGELPFRATEVVKATGDNLVQMGSAYAGFISGTTPLASIGGNPFLIRTYDDLARVWPAMDEASSKEFRKFGVKTLFHWAWPPQNFYGRGTPIRTVKDFDGRKLRTTDPKQAEMLRRLHASSVTLTTEEVPVAMERKVAEGVATASFNILGAKWHEFLEWGRLDDFHIGGPNYEIVNLEAYEALPAGVRATLDAVAAEWSAKMLKEISATEEQARQTLHDKYKVELIKPDAGQINEITGLMKSYWEEWAAQQGPDGMALMKKVRGILGK